MRNFLLSVLSTGIIFSVLLPSQLRASEGRNLPPVAVIASPSNNATFLFGDVVALSGSGSQKNGAPTMTYRWRVKPSGGSWTTVCGPSTSCMDKDYTFTDPGGADEIQYTIELQVVTAYGSNTKTVQVTLRRYLNRTYFVKDHLGSVRATVDEEGTLIGYDDYYPFGLVVSGRSSNSSNPNDETKFTGYEQEDEASLKLYHAGNRMYDPVLGRFNQIDRFTDQYPSLSTYQYSANNVINLIDVNGDSIWIHFRAGGFLGLKKQTVRYENGKLYNKDGTEYTGKTSRFLDKSVKALDDIRDGGDSGNELVTTLQNREDKINIYRANIFRGTENRAGKTPYKKEVNVFWNPNSKTSGIDQNGNTSRPSYIGLAHELGHAENFSNPNGKIENSIWNIGLGDLNPRKHEIYASNWENRIRAENAIALRTAYAIKNNKPAGMLLIPGTNFSLHFPRIYE